MRTIFPAALTLTLGLAPLAGADVLYSNPGGDDGIDASRRSTINPATNPPVPFDAAIVADNFTLPSGGTVDTVRFWGLNLADFSSPEAFISGFRIRIFEDSGADQPGTLVSDQTIPTFQITTAQAGATVYYVYDAPITPVALDAGTRYWLSIAANKTVNSTFEYWSWQRGSVTDGVQVNLQFEPTGPWQILGGFENAVAFELEGAAPPPCVGDLDGDNDTDVFDFTDFSAAFGSSLGDANFNPDVDYDNDDAITVLDFGTWAADFGCPN